MAARSSIPYEVYEEWSSHLNDPTHEPLPFYKPLAGWRLQELETVRRLTRELAEKRLAEEKKATEAAENVPEDLDADNETAQVAEESDEEEIPQAVYTTQISNKNNKFTVANFVPAKKVDADESLFTKYA